MIPLLLLCFWREFALLAAVAVAAVSVAASSVQIDGAMIGGIGTLLVGIGTVVNIFLTARARREIVEKVTVVQKEVTTMNSQNLSELADNTETRRIQALDKAGEPRTATDSSHMRSVEEAADRVARAGRDAPSRRPGRGSANGLVAHRRRDRRRSGEPGGDRIRDHRDSDVVAEVGKEG